MLFVGVSSLCVFGHERVVFWREAARGSGMSLNVTAYFLGKDIVQLPRLALLTLAFAVPFYALVVPTPSFAFYFSCLFIGAYSISGYSYVASIVGGNSAQLVTVVGCLVLIMLSGVGSKHLDYINSIPGLRVLPWLSPLRWFGETLLVAQTRKLSNAWKFSPNVYRNPERDSALALLFGLTFHEGWMLEGYELEEVTNVDDDETVCELKPKVWMNNEYGNLPMLIILGGVARFFALGLLRNTNLTAMGEPPLQDKLLALYRHPRNVKNNGSYMPLSRLSSYNVIVS